MGTWNSSPHPISDLKDWSRSGRLEVRPDFQRREVWNQAARVMLIDTILRDVPMPKMFLWNEVKDDSTHRKVIDGQQRILAILGFLGDEFALDRPYDGPFAGMRFSDLPEPERKRILRYKIDFNEAIEFTEAEVRDVYSRVNKYTLPLNRQELRRADFPGRFHDVSADLAVSDFFDASGVLTVAQRRRMGDVEFVSELLAGMLDGPQDKKEDLDSFYMRYAKWRDEDCERTQDEFRGVLGDLSQVFSAALPLRQTRFKQKSDFYSLFLTVNDLRRSGHRLDGKDLDPLRGDLRLLDGAIAPEADVDVLSEYAIKCVSQANTASSRSWRRNFLTTVLSGTYVGREPVGAGRRLFETLRREVLDASNGSLFDACAECGARPSQGDESSGTLVWEPSARVFQVSNAQWRYPGCCGRGDGSGAPR